jgi:hypothetical protein
MPYERLIDRGFVHYRWQGEFTKADLVGIGRDLPELAAELGYAPNVLHTFPSGLTGNIEPWTVFEHSIRRRNTVLKNPAKVAWVATDPHIVAVGRMLQELNRNPHIEIRIFGAETVARRWLTGRTGSRTRTRVSKPGVSKPAAASAPRAMAKTARVKRAGH